MILLHLSLALSALSVGLVAGYVLAYANSVMPGLVASDDRSFVTASHGIIGAVANPLFLVLSNIPIIALLVAVISALLSPVMTAVPVLTIGALLLYVATLVITFAINLPLNKTLLSPHEASDPNAPAQVRAAFEEPWRRANLARTWTAIGAALAAIAALTLAVSGGSA